MKRLCWGSPGVPVLPSRTMRNHSRHSISQIFHRSPTFAGAKTVEDLDLLWKVRGTNLLESDKEQLVSLFYKLCPADDVVVVPAGIEPRFLEYADLSTRTRNCVRNAHIPYRQDGIFVGDLLSIPGLGVRSLLELMCVSEAGVQRLRAIIDDLGVRGGGTAYSIAKGGNVHESSKRVEVHSVDEYLQIRESGLWADTERTLKEIFSFALDLQAETTMADALKPEFAEIADVIGETLNLLKIALDELIHRDMRPSIRVLNGFRDLLGTFSEQEVQIVEYRLSSVRPKTLQKTGDALGITRERVRQVQDQIESKIQKRNSGHIDAMAKLLRSQLPKVLNEDSLDQRLLAIFHYDTSKAGFLARSRLKRALGYNRKGSILLNDEAEELLCAMEDRAREEADDVGLVDEKVLKNCLPSDDWVPCFHFLIDCMTLKHIGDQLCLRDTAKSRVKCALLQIGRPATRDEISVKCGLSPTKVGGAISNIPSIVRADLKRWGLRDWIEDEYDGITGEILQRIEENGGVASARSLMREIPEKFGVSESSVKAYLGTAQFDVYQDEVRVAANPVFDLLPLREIVSGFDKDGCPYWNFKVENRYFQGYSLSAVPYEIAKEMGCEAGESIRIPVRSPMNCRDLSVSWKLASSTKASIGYVSDALKELGATSGEMVSLVMRRDGSVDFRMVLDSEPVPSATENAEGMLERIKSRRKVL